RAPGDAARLSWKARGTPSRRQLRHGPPLRRRGPQDPHVRRRAPRLGGREPQTREGRPGEDRPTAGGGMNRFLLVAAGGAVGACARYAVALGVAAFWRREFPLATFLVNITGCFVLGFVSALFTGHAGFDTEWRLLLGTGFVGAYTTFSAF